MLGQVMSDLRSETFIKTLTREAIKYREAHSDDPAKSLRKELNDVESRIGKMMMLAADMDDPAPALREVDALEREPNYLMATIQKRQNSSWSHVTRGRSLLCRVLYFHCYRELVSGTGKAVESQQK